ncbi:DUF4870 domain-containing protein [Rugosimonospora acidiphila]
MTQPPTPPWDETQAGGQPGSGAPAGSGAPGSGVPPQPGPAGPGPTQPGYGQPGQPGQSGPGGAPGYGQSGPGGAPGYGQPYGYPPPGYSTGPGQQQPGPPPPGYPSSQDKTWALVAHFGGAVGAVVGGGLLGFVAPLIALQGRGNQSPAVRAHAAAALNFFGPASAVALILIVVRICVGASGGWLFTGAAHALLNLALGAVVVLSAIFGVVGGLRANDGELYKYPVSYPVVR